MSSSHFVLYIHGVGPYMALCMWGAGKGLFVCLYFYLELKVRETQKYLSLEMSEIKYLLTNKDEISEE